MESLIQKTLQDTFGFSSFRPGQKEAILTLLEKGKLLCIQPTGHGKSLLYQLSSCILGGVTLVISPLLALMRDQIHHLNERFHIPAAAINTDQTEEQNAKAREDALQNRIRILFIAPEQLDHVDRFAFLLKLDIRLFVVDEAHCISTWGHDFRPSYRQILLLLSELVQKKPDLKILGLTATANKQVESDIKRQFTLLDSSHSTELAVHRETMNRPNISLSVLAKEGLASKLAACLDLLSSLEGCGLIYCATRENVELVAEFLQRENQNVAPYHAGFDPDQKRELQGAFLKDQYKALIATNALGMGIDKANLRFIIHFDIPGSINAYYQEVGRSGRDGLPSKAILLFDFSDLQVQRYFIESALPSAENFDQVLQGIEQSEDEPNLTAIKRMSGLHPTRVTIILAELVEQNFVHKSSKKGVQVYQSLKRPEKPDLSRYVNQQKVKKEELEKIISYAKESKTCRMAFLRSSLGDFTSTSCGHCDVCLGQLNSQKNSPATLEKASFWLENRPFPIPAASLHKVSEGLSILDSKVRSPLFVRFMKERSLAATLEELPPELLELLTKHFSELYQKTPLGAIIPIPSRTWKAQEPLLHFLSQKFHLPILPILQWKNPPEKRQGELLNNDQRHHNVHQKLELKPTSTIPPGALILFDDYTGSGNTLKEAARTLRANKFCQNDLIPFTIASLKWHLGKAGFS